MEGMGEMGDKGRVYPQYCYDEARQKAVAHFDDTWRSSIAAGLPNLYPDQWERMGVLEKRKAERLSGAQVMEYRLKPED